MKSIFITIFIILNSFIQLPKESVEINYTAQTRGYSYKLLLKNEHLTINTKSIILNTQQLGQVKKSLNKLKFDNLKSSISKKDLQVDKVIEGTFSIQFKNKNHQFSFDHNNLPKEILTLKNQLESFLK